MLYTITCIRCGEDAKRYTRSALMCCGCQNEHNKESLACGRAVAKALRQRILPRATECKCVDCGKNASQWEHRDYLKPLDVQPVCRSCNAIRGPALDSVLRVLPPPRARQPRQLVRNEARMRA